MLARAVGGPPWLPYGDVRAIFAVRLRTFLNGDAGVSAALCQRLAEMLNAGLVPAVPAAAWAAPGRSSRWRTRSARWWASARCWAGRNRRPAGGALRVRARRVHAGAQGGHRADRRASRRDRAGLSAAAGGRAAGLLDAAAALGGRRPGVP